MKYAYIQLYNSYRSLPTKCTKFTRFYTLSAYLEYKENCWSKSLLLVSHKITYCVMSSSQRVDAQAKIMAQRNFHAIKKKQKKGSI